MKYAEKHEVAKAALKYNKSPSYIYFWRSRWDGSIKSLAEKSKKPRSHPAQHTEEEIKMIHSCRLRNPELGLTELWHRFSKKDHTRCPESLYRVMKKPGLLPNKPKHPKHKPRSYEQITHPGERVQNDVKVVPRKCIADPEMKLYQYTASDEYLRMCFLYGYEEQSTYSSADFAERVVKWFKRCGITVECIQTVIGFEFTTLLYYNAQPRSCQALLQNEISHSHRHPHTLVLLLALVQVLIGILGFFALAVKIA